MKGNIKEILLRLIKYLVIGIGVSVASFYITNKKNSIRDIVSIGIVAASIFSILDLVCPSVSADTQFGSVLPNEVPVSAPIVINDRGNQGSPNM